MALQDDIRNEITEGRLQPQWTTADLLANTHLAATYQVSTLRTDPPNRSVSYPELGLGDGFHVRNGATSIFVRVGRIGRRRNQCQRRPNVFPELRSVAWVN